LKPIGVLAIGQGGASIAADFAKTGFLTAAINTSEADLRAVEHDIPNRLLLYGNGGAGKDRALGFQAVKDNLENIEMFLNRHFESNQLKALLVIFTLGGGTGSGAGPAIASLATAVLPNLIVCPVVVLPDYADPAISRINAVNAFADISGIEGVGATFVIDNEKGKRNHAIMGQGGNYFPHTNREFVKAIFGIVQIPEVGTSTVSNFDYQEFFSLMAQPGMAGVFDAEIPVPFDGDWSILLDRAYRHSVLADPNEAKQVGLIIQAPPAIGQQLASAIKFVPEPVVLHRGIYDAGNKLTVFLAGMQWPMERLKATESSVTQGLDNARKPIEAYRPAGVESPFSFRKPAQDEQPRGVRVAKILERLERK
jgi:cell division GTPase FtsZ